MYRIIDLNDTGKTRKLLTECSNNDGLFICRHPERVVEKCIAYGIPIVRAIGYDEFRKVLRLNKECVNDSSNVYIDELERFVNYIIPYLKGFSMTIEEGE